MHTLIIGDDSFIGKHLTAHLVDSGMSVVTTSREEQSVYGTQHIQLDLAAPDYSFLQEFAFTNIVVLAGITNPRLCDENPALAQQVNVAAVETLVQELATHSSLKRFIFPSSVTLVQDGQDDVDEESAVDPTKNVYTQTKYAAEQLLLRAHAENNFPSIVFRFPNIYGPQQEWQHHPTFIVQNIVQAIQDGAIEIWNDDTIRDWVYIDDIIALLGAALKSTAYGLFQVGSGIGTSTGDIARTIAEIAGVPYNTLGIAGHGPKHVVTNPQKVQSTFHWKAETPLATGIQETYRYYKHELTEHV